MPKHFKEQVKTTSHQKNELPTENVEKKPPFVFACCISLTKAVKNVLCPELDEHKQNTKQTQQSKKFRRLPLKTADPKLVQKQPSVGLTGPVKNPSHLQVFFDKSNCIHPFSQKKDVHQTTEVQEPTEMKHCKTNNPSESTRKAKCLPSVDSEAIDDCGFVVLNVQHCQEPTG